MQEFFVQLPVYAICVESNLPLQWNALNGAVSEDG